MYELFARFADAPELALIPAGAFALLAVLFRQRALWLVAALWALYAAYEAGVAAGILCSGDCAIRVDLLLIAPGLLLASVGGLVWAAVRGLRTRPR